MDFRFHTAIRDFLIAHKLTDQYDVVSLAGASKSLVEGDVHGAPVLLKQLELSKKLHDIQEVYLIHHTDCGAYGGKAAFASDHAEREKHDADTLAAAAMIRKQEPSLVVHRFLARLAEDGEISFEKLG